jgi:hypothetical protein
MKETNKYFSTSFEWLHKGGENKVEQHASKTF